MKAIMKYPESKGYNFPISREVKDILIKDNDIEKNIDELAERITSCMNIINAKHLYESCGKEKVLTGRQVMCTINAIDAATEHRAETTRREILDILEKRKGRLSITEIYMIYIVLCRWKQSIL